MINEIICRAKTKLICCDYNNGKDDGEWVEGYLYHDIGAWKIKQFEISCANYVSYEVDPDTIYKYINIKDKNGIKIFENNIIKKEFYTDWNNYYNSEEYEGIVKYRSCAWNIIHINNKNYTTPIFMAIEEYGEETEHFIVRGNVFDNPELLEN